MAEYTATSGSYTTTLTVTEGAYDIASNTSPVTFTLTLKKNSGTGLWNNDSCPWSININGTSYSGSFTYDFRNYSSLTLKSSTTQTITHDSDGTKSISVSASVNMDNTPYVYTMSPSGTLTLATIPRASDVSVASSYSIANTSSSLSATISPKANFYHRWKWSIGSYTSGWTTLGQSSATQTISVVNTSMLSQLPSATSGSVTFTVETHNGNAYSSSTLVGSKTATSTVSVNTSNIKPSVSLGTIGLNSTPISGYAVAGHSKVQSAWSTSNSYGATSVTTYFTVSTGSLATTSSSSTSGTVVSNVIPSNASNYTLTIYAYAKDSRGAVGTTVSKSITVYGYQPPTANLSAYRTSSSSSTSEDGAGTYAYVTFSGAVRSSVNSQNTIQSTVCTYSGSISGTATNGGHYALADTQTVTFTLTVTDKVTSSTASVTISPASYPLDLVDDGNGNVGVGMGTIAQVGYVETPLTFRVSNDKSSGGVDIREDGEGGTIDIYSKNGKTFEIDAYNDNLLRVWSTNDSGTYVQGAFNRLTGELSSSGGFAGKATSAGTADNATNATNATYAQYPVIMDMSNKNLNDIKMQGVYYGYTGMTNAPTQGIATMEVIRYTGDWLIQRFTRIFDNGLQRVDERVFYNGNTWGAWKRVPLLYKAFYSTSILGGGSATLSNGVTSFERLRINAIVGGSVLATWEIDTGNITTNQNNRYSYSVPIYVSDPGDWYLTIIELSCYLSGSSIIVKPNFYNKRIGTSGQSTQNNNNNYRIYRIDGIL